MIQNFTLLTTCVGSGMASIKPEMVVSFASSISDPENKYVIKSSPNALMSFKTNRKMPFPDRYKTIIRKMTTSLNVVFLIVRIHFRRNFIVNIPIMKRKTCLKRLFWTAFLEAFSNLIFRPRAHPAHPADPASGIRS